MNEIKKTFTSQNAKDYENRVGKTKWLDPDIVFGMAFKHINPGDSVLDIGIGTGLSSAFFHKAGLEVHGIDFSPEMLKICKSKNMAVSLHEHDLSVTPYPCGSNSINHAVCTGVMHLFEELDTIFQEVGRILKKDGVFTFVVSFRNDDEEKITTVNNNHAKTKKSVKIYCHSASYLSSLIKDNGFEDMGVLNFSSAIIGKRLLKYRAYVLKKN